MSSQDIIHLKKSIKEWEHLFQRMHGRPPNKEDMKLDPKIHKLYKAYRIAKAGPKKQKPQPRSNIDMVVTFSDDESSDHEVIQTAELGPTPQANGKVLLILDIHLTPPELSPIKRSTAQPQIKVEGVTEFKTPTKTVKKLNFSDLTPLRNRIDVASRLHMAAEVTPEKPAPHIALETPQYLAKYNRKLNVNLDSPERVELRSSPFLTASPEVHTPTKNTLSPSKFQVSPSPLKSHRFMSFGARKKLSDIYNDFRSIEFEEEEQFDGVDEEVLDTVDTTLAPRKKVTTQKRTTRRWKIKPRSAGDGHDQYANKDIHNEIRRLDEQKRKQLEDYIEENVSEEEELNSDEELERLRVAKELAAASKKTSNSENYQRLRINDPRTKRFKMMKRR